MTRFHLALNHLQDAHTLQIYMHGHTFALAAHTTETWSHAKTNHPVLSAALNRPRSDILTLQSFQKRKSTAMRRGGYRSFDLRNRALICMKSC